MCGITGYWSRTPCSIEVVERMASAIKSRGLDDSGSWVDLYAHLALAHRRLSILDLSPAGAQPMHSLCGRYVLVFNGEIYNHLDIRKELKDAEFLYEWVGCSDTETLLVAIQYWGIEKALEKINGMFAFAFWDSQCQELILARDRLGEKPLYYGVNNNIFLFGSELKAITSHPDWVGEICRNSLSLYMRHSYIPAPFSIYKGINKLEPGSYVCIRNKGLEITDPCFYWKISNISEAGCSSSVAEPRKLIDELDFLLTDSIKLRMTADVPVGAFLSGGFDSSIVTAIMQKQSMQPVKTFSIGFDEADYNEAEHAKAVAKYLGTDHTELYITSKDAIDVVPKLPYIYDEPFADSSQIPTFLVCELARRQVSVSLSGDGGDELFYGYSRYLTAERIWGRLEKIPLVIRRVAAFLALNAPAKALESAMHVLPKKFQIEHLADRLPKIAEILTHKTGADFYRELVSHWNNPESIVLGSVEPHTILNSKAGIPVLPSLREQMMYFDQMTYLPGDILTKVDRASMAVGLEARVPILDHRLVEFAWRVPTDYKYRDGQSKWLLRQVLYRYLPRELMDRPKMGFGVPIDSWLRGPLQEWAEGLLDPKRLRNEGFFNPELVQKMWLEHLSGKRRWHYHLWDVLMFQAWLETQ